MTHAPALPLSTTKDLLRAAMLLLFAGAIMACALYAWMSLGAFSAMRTYALIDGIVAGVGATICLAGAMYYVDTPLNCGLPWYLRWVFKSMKRVLMVAQLLCMGLAAGSALEMIFGFGIPGT